MSGTKEGALKTKDTIVGRWGIHYYANIGRKGGKRCVPKGFALNRELASQAGRKGGLKGKRGKVVK